MNITFTNKEDYELHINTCIDTSIPLIIVGPPGCGKSENIRQITESRNSIYITRAAQLLTVGELTGFLFVDRENKSFDPYHSELAKELLNAEKETIFHIQDLLLAKPETRDAIMSLVRLREIHGQRISDNVKFVMDTNSKSHGAGTGQNNTALNNRCSIIHAFIDTEAWIKWALQNDIAKEIILFVHANPDFSYINEGEIPKNGFEGFNTFRSWELLSPFVKRGIKNFATIQSIIGNVENVASEFLNFWDSLDEYGNLVAKVKNNPDSAPVFGENESGKILGSIFILSNHMEKDNVSNFTRYIKRYNNDEYVSLLLQLGVQTHPDAKETREYVNHVTNNQ